MWSNKINHFQCSFSDPENLLHIHCWYIGPIRCRNSRKNSSAIEFAAESVSRSILFSRRTRGNTVRSPKLIIPGDDRATRR